MAAVNYQVHGDIAVLTIDKPPVNALGHEVRAGLMAGISQALADPAVRAGVVIGAGKTFPAGADIREFGQPKKDPSLFEVLAALEGAAKPFVAAIHGTAFGGGLETALACALRIGAADAKVGLPEVKLGLLPGAGGTQRLTRIIGPVAALDVITTGRPIDAAKAHALGILDEVAAGDLLEAGLNLARRAASGAVKATPVRDRSDMITDVDPTLFERARVAARRKSPDFKAPLRIIDCIEAATTLPFEQGLAVEQAGFAALVADRQSKALSHLFFAEREAAKIAGVTGEVDPAPVASVGIVGAGTMGGGIAMCFINVGIPVTLVDTTEPALQAGLARVRANYDRSVSRGSMAADVAERALARLTLSTRMTDLAAADLVIEAVFENMDVKKDLFRTLDAICKPDAILASNTSTLDVDAIGSVLAAPGRFIGMHFFSPANVMRLLENVRPAAAAPRTIATAMSIGRMIGKVPVLAGNCDGFIGNRILHAYGREADLMLEEGATPWQVDGALKRFGFPMGLFLMRDMAGLDVGWRIRQERAKVSPPGLGYTSTVADRICERGRFGQKTGSGYYLYQGRDATPDPEIEDLIADVAAGRQVKRRAIADAEVVERIMAAIVNEGARVLEEGIAQRSGDIDIVYCNGYGFPSHLGGPMFWAEGEGLATMAARVRAYHETYGSRWTPAALLLRASSDDQRWSDLRAH